MLDYDTIVTALFMDGNEYNRCTGCGKMTQESKLSSGRCDICSAPVKGMPMAAALDMDAIVEKVVIEAGLLDVFRKKPQKDEFQILEDMQALINQGAKKTEDQGYRDMQEGLNAPWKKLRKRFPKK